MSVVYVPCPPVVGLSIGESIHYVRIIGVILIPISKSHCLIHAASFAASATDMYSASVIDRLTVFTGSDPTDHRSNIKYNSPSIITIIAVIAIWVTLLYLANLAFLSSILIRYVQCLSIPSICNDHIFSHCPFCGPQTLAPLDSLLSLLYCPLSVVLLFVFLVHIQSPLALPDLVIPDPDDLLA